MASLINFSGIASGIDSGALIKALLDQQRSSRIKPLEQKIASLTDTNDALDSVGSLLDKFKTVLTSFRTLNGGALAKSASSTDEATASASPSNSAANGVYTLTVSSRASNATLSFDDRFSSGSSTINSAINNGSAANTRTVSVEVGSGVDQEVVDIELTNATTIDGFVAAFNEQASNAEASLINVGTAASPSYAISITSNSTGTERGLLAVSVGSEITSAGSGAFTSSSTSQATNASFTVAGIGSAITRATNEVSDVVSGVTFHLNGTGSAQVTVADDSQTTVSSMQQFVDAYNDLHNKIFELDALTREDDSENSSIIFGPLANSSLDENIISAIRNAFTQASTSGGTVNTLADLGITTQRDGTLAFDTDIFESALESDPESVRTITESLGDTLASVDGVIAQFTRFNGLIGQANFSNKTSISGLNSRIVELEKSLSNQEASLNSRFSRLEGIIGKLNSQQAALSSLL